MSEGQPVKRVYIPRIYTLLKWTFLVIIAISTALVGFFQSMLVSFLYEVRSQFIYSLVLLNENIVVKFLQYMSFNLLLAFGCSFSLFLISPAASGSGIPDVKAYLNGVESPIFRNFFTIKTFVAKVIGSALAVSSSLVMGKEGPMLHAGSILAVILGSNKWMQQQMERAAHWGIYTYNKEIRDLVAIGAACGVTTAFKAPVGGVLFAFEMASRWRKELTWRCFLACAITLVVVREAVNICAVHGHCSNLKWGSLIWFQLSFPVPYNQIWAIVLLAIISGYFGCLFTSFNTWICIVRKKWTKFMWARIAEVCAISMVTSLFFFFMPVAGRCKVCDLKTGDQCVRGGAQFKTFQGFRCNDPGHYNDMATLVFNPQGFVTQALFTAHSGTFSLTTLLLYSLVYWLFAAITYGAFIPSGLFTPSLIFGGCLGRFFAEVLVHIHVANNDDVGLYALIGAAGFLGGLMRMSAAQALILMEMTQAPAQLPFLMLVLVISKNVGDCFNYSVFDHQMMLKNLPFMGISDSHTEGFHINAFDVMAVNDGSCTLFIRERGDVLLQALDTHRDSGAFPVTSVPEDNSSGTGKGVFAGFISRRNVTALLDEFGPNCEDIDLSPKVEIAPVVIPPNMPLPFIYRLMNNEGLEYVPVVRAEGILEGYISRLELVNVQNQRLDTFHLKEQIEHITKEVDKGNVIGSMRLKDNIHALAFRRILENPFAAIKKVLEKDDKPEGFDNDVDPSTSSYFLKAGDVSTNRTGGDFRTGPTQVNRRTSLARSSRNTDNGEWSVGGASLARGSVGNASLARGSVGTASLARNSVGLHGGVPTGLHVELEVQPESSAETASLLQGKDRSTQPT